MTRRQTLSPRRLLLAALVAAAAPPACGGPDSSGVPVDPPAKPWDGISPAPALDVDPRAGVVHVRIDAAPLPASALASNTTGPPAPMWPFAPTLGYSGSSPGPTIRARRGDRVIVDFRNRLGRPTTVHWHGMHVPFEMDGAHWMHAHGIADGGEFRFEFQVDQAGTFWYHPHFDTAQQVDGGLFGAVVVEAPDEPEVDADLVLVLDVWGEAAIGGPGAHGGPHPATGAQPVTPGAHQSGLSWRVNNRVQPRYAVKGGSTVRVRMINASNHGYLDLRWPEMRRIAGDQGLLAVDEHGDSALLAPGDRSEFEWSIGAAGFTVESRPYTLHGGRASGPAQPLLFVDIAEPAPAPQRVAWPFSGAKPTLDSGSPDIVYVLQGDTSTDEWLINGQQFPDVIAQAIPLGATKVVEVRNLSPTEHPFHIHGHAFELISRDGMAASTFTWEDTINVPVHGTVRLRLRADNPGDWMAHCHILEHAEGGMMTILRVH